MTEDRKEILIKKMIDAPDSLSDEELELIVGDDELRDIYDMSAAVKGACIQPTEGNIAEEWKRFRPRLVRSPRPSWDWAMRVAAIFLGVMLLSSITVKLVDFIFSPPDSGKPLIAKEEKTHVPEKPALAPPIVESDPETAIPAQTPKTTSAGKVSRTPKQTVADTPTTPDIDIDEYLRIQQARIENEIAEVNAEIYLAEYKAMQQWSREMSGSNSENLQDGVSQEEANFIREITMK